MAQEHLHKNIIQNFTPVCQWYKDVSSKLAVPIYSSYDIRDSGYKVTNVDANIYPAGFNNICPTDKESSPALMGEYVKAHYGDIKKILLVTEEHTKNPYYTDNVYWITQLLTQAGYEVRVAFPKAIEGGSMELTSATGQVIKVESAMPGSDLMNTYKPDLIISNNDFSDAHDEWAKSVSLPINPPRELGWYQRKKSRYFRHYNELATEFAEMAGVDPFLLRVETEEFPNFEIESTESRAALSARVDAMIQNLKTEYAKRGVTQEPFVFVKNNAGTYGLGVMRVGAGHEVNEWTYKNRKTMKAAKGGRDIEEVIIQEGIPSVVKSEGASAEPVIYMIGHELAGGFLRTHGERNDTESLNTPGAVYRRMCVSDLAVDLKGCPKENVYGWSAKLGLLAIAREAKEMGVEFKNYRL